MTRQEQIQKAAFEYANKSIQDKGIAYLEFIEAAEWADATLIEKVCNWLYNNAEDYTIDGGLSIECLMYSFKKAMEE